MPDDAVRARTRELVSAYVPGGDRDALSRAEVLTALDTLADPFSREAQAAHITASAVIVGRRGTVLLRHKITNTWLQPGGHVDGGETPWDAVLREVEEETGLRGTHRDVTRLFDIDVHDTPRGHRHLDLRFIVETGDADPVPGEGESPHVRWFGWDEALVVADASLSDVLPKARTWR